MPIPVGTEVFSTYSISYHETSFNWLAKDRGHTISNGNHNFIMACGVSCLFQTVGTAVRICTLFYGGHMNVFFFLVTEPLYSCRRSDRKVWKNTKSSWAICSLLALEPPNKKLLQNRSSGWQTSHSCHSNQQICLVSWGPAPEEDAGFCYEIYKLCLPTIYFQSC